ncbi:hypothetical protein FPQ18DRAFT_353257, partial [Pyronema domesticum]
MAGPRLRFLLFLLLTRPNLNHATTRPNIGRFRNCKLVTSDLYNTIGRVDSSTQSSSSSSCCCNVSHCSSGGRDTIGYV